MEKRHLHRIKFGKDLPFLNVTHVGDLIIPNNELKMSLFSNFSKL